MKTILKKINVLAMSGLMLSGGLAYAANSTRQAPNVVNTAGANEQPHWEAIEDPQNPGNCDQATSRPCLGFQASPEAEVDVLQTGNYTP